jgi:hypothetical protein
MTSRGRLTSGTTTGRAGRATRRAGSGDGLTISISGSACCASAPNARSGDALTQIIRAMASVPRRNISALPWCYASASRRAPCYALLIKPRSVQSKRQKPL